MKKNYKEEFISLVQRYKESGFEYGKPLEYLEFRNRISKQDIENEIINCNQIEFVDKQKEQEETRYKSYFVYSSKSGRVYIIKFTNKIRIITIYPLGPHTLKRYKRRFKKSKHLSLVWL